MTARQALVSAAVALLITLAIMLEWAALPPSLGAAEPKAVSITANFRPGKGGRAVLADSSGWQAEVRCGKVRPLCEPLKSRPNQRVEMRIVRAGLLGELWVSSAVVDGQELLHLPELEEAFSRSKVAHIAVAGVFLLAAATFAGYAYTIKRASSPDAA